MLNTSRAIGRTQTVTEFTRSLKAILENSFPFVSISGEVSNLKRPFSGHLYFTLKDSESQIKAVLFKTQQRYLPQNLADGDKIICRGRLSVYEARGDYQIIVDAVDFAGEGALQIAFQQLKLRLASEGLFEPARKKKLPFLPAGIALITSPQGAAIHDFLETATCRFPSIPIEIYPVAVQGDKAVPEIIRALHIVEERATCDVIILCRGGGSLEDLWAFNSEALARALAALEIPVVSAIGHEIDFTIADLVADYRAATPTAAAAIIPEQARLKATVSRLKQRLRSSLARRISDLRQRIGMQLRLLRDPSATITSSRMRLDHLQSALIRTVLDSLRRHRDSLARCESRLQQHNPQWRLNTSRATSQALAARLRSALLARFDQKRRALNQAESLLNALSPLAVLERGYAIVRKKGGTEVLRSTRQVAVGERLEVQLHEGRLDCEVISNNGS